MIARTPLLAGALLLAACSEPAGPATDSDASTGAASTDAPDPTDASTGTTAEPVPTTSDTTGAPGCDPGCGADEACIAGVCEGVGLAEVERGCHPIADPAGRGECVYPWPSNFYTAPARDSATGLAVALPAALLPMGGGAMFPTDELLTGNPGFSPNAQIRFAFAAAIDPAPLPGLADIGASLADDAPIVLLRVSTGERWPYFAEVDATADAGEPTTVFVRPMQRLAFGERWIVAVRGLRDQAGQELAAPPLFRALRDDLPTDVAALEGERARYADIFAALESAGVERGGLQLAWDFTTNTEEALRRDFVAMAPQIVAHAEGGDLGYTIDAVDEDPGGDVPIAIRGRFTVPSCLAGDSGPGQVFARDAAGLPDCSGTAEARFWLGVPATVVEAGAPAPVVVYGHGLLGTGEEALYVAARGGNFIVAGTDFWGMSEDDVPTIAGVLGANFTGGRILPDRLLQSAANFTTLAYLAQGELADEPALAGLVDPSVVHYIGGSQGGIMGGTVAAMAPNLRRAVLVVGGANYSLMIWRSSSFAEVNALWSATQPDTQRREFLMALYQAAFDFADPLTHARWIAEPPDGGEPKRLLLLESIGDSQVPNIATEAMARSYGMPMAAPAVYPVWGVEEVAGKIEGSALLQVDTQMGPLPPVENLPPAEDNGAHGAAVDGPAAQQIVQRFLADGVVENVCDGPCDPD